MLSIVEIMTQAVTCPVIANENDELGEYCVYSYETTYYNGARRDVRLKVSIFADTMARGVELETALDQALVTLGEDPLTDTCTRCVRNGGGWLIDGDRHIRIAYYDLTLRA